jgi:membrane-bound ClpP family serine protease
VKVNGEQVTLRTKDAAIRPLSLPGQKTAAAHHQPKRAFVLISLGTLGITWEFIIRLGLPTEGMGAICLLIGFLALAPYPSTGAARSSWRWRSCCFIADVFMSAHGVLTAGGSYRW